MIKKPTAAITLTEIMIAVAILGFVILPIFGLLNYTNRGTREQDAEGIAANLAKEEMNRLMYVISRDNLLSAAGSAQTWSFGSDYDVKGNKFTGAYTVFPFSNDELGFIIPAFKFHDPMGCNNGLEANPGSALDPAKTMTLAAVFPDSADKCRLADIRLVVRWHLPGGEYNSTSQFQLLARRAFVDKE
ncbi:MAG TPA: hypothetical protein PLM07_09750 [Candidatus Rifleibacterium sp.]|nr:hypothetical protein [Candidatus Rifleibacterium sp.]